jgi:DNA-binding NarL/FixJ family response regulator
MVASPPTRVTVQEDTASSEVADWQRLQAFSAPEPAPAEELEALTPREREVLHHLASGYAYKQIGARLGMSVRTVESHVGAVLRKLQLSSRHEVTHWAAARGLSGGDDGDTA